MCIRLHCKAGSDVHARTFHARIFALDAIAVIAGCVGVPEGIEPGRVCRGTAGQGRWQASGKPNPRGGRGGGPPGPARGGAPGGGGGGRPRGGRAGRGVVAGPEPWICDAAPGPKSRGSWRRPKHSAATPGS
ncbi:MAG: hypothetical protein IPF50_06555 [Proteobacteria bacterium]|nr:hypothetical protein [Pseudomonadota bacterium]